MKNTLSLMLTLILISTNLLMSSFTANANPPDWQWAKSAGGAADDMGISIATDHSGNVFVAGAYMSDSIMFGNYLSNAGAADLFLAKYDAAGNILWAKKAGGLSDDMPFDISTDAAGNVLLTGVFFSDSIVFDGITLYNSGIATSDIFMVKYNSGGTVIWAKSAGGTDIDEGRSICADATGNIYLTGGFRSPTASFGAISMTLNGTGDVFVAKYDSSGTALWVKGSSGTNFQEGNGIAVDASGNIYVTGMFYSATLAFDAISLTGNGSSDMFLVAYNNAGTVLWAKNCGGSSYEEGMGIAVHSSGALYICGLFRSSTATFQTVTLNNSGALGSNEIYLAKFSNTGNLIWAKSAGGSGDDESSGIALHNQNIIITGGFTSSIANFGIHSVSTAGMQDIFVAAYDTSGTELWASRAGGMQYDTGNDVVIDGNQNIYHTGYFESDSVGFSNSKVYNSGGGADMFLAKIPLIVSGLEHTNTIERTIATASPNPFATHTTISIHNFPISKNKLSITLTDLSGRLIQQQIFEQPQVILYRNHLPAGTYFYQIKSENKMVTTGKLLIE